MLTYAPAVSVLKGRDDVDIQKSGFLFKQTGHSIRKWKEYYFRLARMSLLCYRKDTDVRNGKEPKFKIELSDIEDITHVHKKNQPTKQLFLVFEQGALSLRSEELADAKDWIEKLRIGVSMCQRRRELHSELMRASFKMAVEQNLRNKYVHSNPKKIVDEMPKKTFLRRIDLKQTSPASSSNKVSFLPPLGPGKRSISIGGNIVSKQDSMACFQQRQASPYWKNKNFKTIYKNINKDSLRKSLLKKNASREISMCAEDEQNGSMIITTNLSFENMDKLEDDDCSKPVPVYSSLDGLNRMGDEHKSLEESYHHHHRNRRHSGDTDDQGLRFDSRMHCGETDQRFPNKKPVLDRSMSCQQSKYLLPNTQRKYSPAKLFGSTIQNAVEKYPQTFMDPRIMNMNAKNTPVMNGPMYPQFERHAPQYRSFEPIRPSLKFHRDLPSYRSLNSFHGRCSNGPSVQQRAPLNTISENEGSGQVQQLGVESILSNNKGFMGRRSRLLNSDELPGDNNMNTPNKSSMGDIRGHKGDIREYTGDTRGYAGDNRGFTGHFDAKALWSKEFYDQLVHKDENGRHNTNNYYVQDKRLALDEPIPGIPRVKLSRSVSSSTSTNSPAQLNNVDYTRLAPAGDVPKVVTRSNTFNGLNPQVYSSGCVPLLSRPDALCGPDMLSQYSPSTSPGELWRNANCIK